MSNSNGQHSDDTMSYYGFLVRHATPNTKGSRIPRRQFMGRFAKEVMLLVDVIPP